MTVPARVLQVLIATSLYSSFCEEQENESVSAEIADYTFCKVPQRIKFWRENIGKHAFIARGCRLDSGENVPLGSTVRTKNFILRCERDGAIGAKLVRTKCIVGNVVIPFGEGKPVGRLFYECTNITDSCVAYKVSGCVDQNGERVTFGSYFWISHFSFHCKRLPTRAIAIVTACGNATDKVPIDGKKSTGGFWFSCKSKPPKVTYGIVACSGENGSMIKPSETFRRGEYIYQCIKNNDTTWSIVPTGCVANEFGQEREYKIGEGWYTTPVGNMSFLKECFIFGDHALSVVAACILRNERNSMKIIEPGCVTPYEDGIFVCQRQTNMTAKGFVIPAKTERSIYDASRLYDARLC